MNYKEAVNYLFSKLPVFQRTGAAAYKEGLENTLKLDAFFNHPHTQYKTIHVAGTNGKGSVSHTLASILTSAGYKTGLYTSPHLIDFRERIRMNGLMITENEVTAFVTENKKIIEKLEPSFFEMTVALAFDYFARSNVDIAVIEVGLGGRLDSTNIITPLLSVITNIGYDHTQFLGNTLASIAREKAGIIKAGVPVVIGESHPETESVFYETATNLKSKVFFADKEFDPVTASRLSGSGKQVFNISKNGKMIYRQLNLDLGGFYQRKNILTILKSVEILQQQGISISNENIYKGCSQVSSGTGLQGRWQVVKQNPTVICDTGHNKEGIEMVVAQIAATPHHKLHWIFGMVNDKDTAKILEILPRNAQYYFTRAAIPRALDEELLADRAFRAGLQGQHFPKVEDAYRTAISKAHNNDLIMIGGSTFIVADFLSITDL